MDYKSPTFLIVAGVGLVAAFILLRNKGSSAAPQSTTTSTTGDITNTNSPQTDVNPVGGSYSYLDGSGMQHIIATDPYGNLVGYSNLPPDIGNPQANELANYVGSMSGNYLLQPYGGTTPYYSTAPTA